MLSYSAVMLNRVKERKRIKRMTHPVAQHYSAIGNEAKEVIWIDSRTLLHPLNLHLGYKDVLCQHNNYSQSLTVIS